MLTWFFGECDRLFLPYNPSFSLFLALAEDNNQIEPEIKEGAITKIVAIITGCSLAQGEYSRIPKIRAQYAKPSRGIPKTKAANLVSLSIVNNSN